jgi:hypothetical protein
MLKQMQSTQIFIKNDKMTCSYITGQAPRASRNWIRVEKKEDKPVAETGPMFRLLLHHLQLGLDHLQMSLCRRGYP